MDLQDTEEVIWFMFIKNKWQEHGKPELPHTTAHGLNAEVVQLAGSSRFR